MQFDKDVLIKYRMERSKETIKEARIAIDNKFLYMAQNRIYYAIFYIVSALALKNNFSTSKHSQLMGWFNNNFVNTGIVQEELGEIYRVSFRNRQKSDYDDMIHLDRSEVENHFKDMLHFVGSIEKLIHE
jgi:hypothetical protein